ncbi:DUF47 domain-containing protein [Vagococcus xieshaowenii]|uniref:DUF47 family protein n=1 Tax=Vagococcus xieshaowenii TaxID=2562451 RepID=A0AAJ5EEN1_9ENTE|nr:DUF47 family protein [Vagococcus xieshaowenii]QCA29315.1 DUF47 family protein [Vagococcus xieshaowenii]TFZ41990.1 DUF47 family protein [Vagococcus xieshaowenii]
MARRKEFNYFENLTKLAEKSEQAAKKMQELINNFSEDKVATYTHEVHEIEREADQISHNILNELNHSFVTPIDREDIVSITEELDNICDAINSLTYLFDTYAVTELRADTDKIASYVVEATHAVVVATKEFAKFKQSKILKSKIDLVNEIEEKTDTLYRSLIKELITKEDNVMNVIKWKNIYEGFEVAVNNTEKSADILYGLVIKNT